jgi:hypothetical protein
MTDTTAITKLVEIARGAAIAAPQTDAAMGAGRVLGRLLWQNMIGPVGDEAFETLLFERHGPALAKAASPAETPFVDWLHVISESYDYGGHTALLEALVAMQVPQQRIAIAVTTSATPRFSARCAQLGTPLYRLRGRLLDKAVGLVALGRRAARIMLHIHPDDLGAALAARVLRDEGRRVVFLNHADHVFSFGPGAADIVAEISGFGWRLTAERRMVRAQHFLGIPLTHLPTALAPSEVARAIAEGPILSIGHARKYRPAGTQNFPAFLMELMRRTDRTVELIGPSPADPWWQPVLARHGDRLRLRGPLPYEETCRRLSAAACYVDSFPVTGGSALTQGLMAGKAVFALAYPAGGYSLADIMRSNSAKEMVEQILAFLASGKESVVQSETRARVAAEFGKEALARRLARLDEGAQDPPPAEMLAAARDLNYHADMWRACGQPVFTHPPHARPSPVARLALTARLLCNSQIEQPNLLSTLCWTLLGFRISDPKLWILNWRTRGCFPKPLS